MDWEKHKSALAIVSGVLGFLSVCILLAVFVHPVIALFVFFTGFLYGGIYAVAA